jgi:ABC-type multidrug transport system fused ATPase/permease subunit
LRSLDPRSYRSQIGLVMQTPALFSLAIRDNIALGNPNVSFDEIVRAARLANIHDEILALPGGYDARLSASVRLSPGQCQRLSLARALVRRPDVLLLDEATSAVDAITEAAIQGTLQGLGCLRLVVAHRLSTVRDADRIVVLAEGHVVEEGTHERLLGRKSHYYDLVHAQMDAEGNTHRVVARS